MNKLPWIATALALFVVVGSVGSVAGQGTQPEWTGTTYDELVVTAERYNSALDAGASPRLTDDRVTLRVTSDGAGGTAHYAFVLSRSGRITDLQAGEYPDPTLVLTTSKGTVGYLATAPNPTVAVASVFGRLGDVRGPNVEARDDGFVLHESFPKVWKTYVVVPTTVEGAGENATLRLTINEEGVEEEAGEKPEGKGTPVLDILARAPELRRLPGSDLDSDGSLDVVTFEAGANTPGVIRLDATESVASGGVRGVAVADIGEGARSACSGESQGDRIVRSWDWGNLRCDGLTALDYLDPDDDADVLYVLVPADGQPVVGAVSEKNALGGDGNLSLDDVNEALRMKAKEKANKTKCNNSLSRGTDSDAGSSSACEDLVLEVTPGSVGGADAFDVTVNAGTLSEFPRDTTLVRTLGDGSFSTVEVYHAVAESDPESIEPITARGVGLVNGVKWAIISFLAGLGL